MNDIIYDIETYPNCFVCVFRKKEWSWVFEISDRKNDYHQFIEFCNWLKSNSCRMVGFNNIGFDYPVIHKIIYDRIIPSPYQIYRHALSIIQSNDKFKHIIWPSDRYVFQLDLFKIHHFDNKAKSTSLKALEINMRLDDVRDLPFEPGTTLNDWEMNDLIKYCKHDTLATEKFYEKSLDKIRFRDELSIKYHYDFTNHNDAKIGKDYIILRLGKDYCYRRTSNGRQPIQTPRPYIALKDAIFPYIKFENQEFDRVLEYLKNQTITETKGVFKGLSATINNFKYDFGTGGIHGSVSKQVIKSNDDWIIYDIDVASYYPSLAIANRVYPEHLGDVFCDIYEDIKKERFSYPKGTPENSMLKLALNAVFGDSNNQYSCFYDPLYTMKITINGQLLLLMLAEQLMNFSKLIQINTDGMTLYLHRSQIETVKQICKWWESFTLLELESAEYKRMWIRDVNNYIAEKNDSKLKRKGAYEYELEWHKDHSSLVIQKAVEAYFTRGIDIEDFIINHQDPFDFMIKAKVPRTSRLMYGDEEIQKTSRYFVSNRGESLTKIMPPLAKKPGIERPIGISVGWKTTICNRATDFDWSNLNYEYYVKEAEKLIF